MRPSKMHYLPKVISTTTAHIYVGFKVNTTGKLHTLKEAKAVCQKYSNEEMIGVTFSPTEFLYPQGNEPGVVVGLINYPRFPSSTTAVRDHALELGHRLLEALEQERLTVVMDNWTFTLSAEGHDD